MEAPPQKPGSSKTKLNLLDTTSLIVGIIIGAGIFHLPGLVFAGTAGPWQAIGLWVLGGLIALVGALCFAELASTYPRSGGEYVYLSRALGRPAGFLFAWVQLTVIRTAGSTGILAFLFGFYASRFVGLEHSPVLLLDFIESNTVTLFSCGLALAAITILTGINILGVYFGKTTQNVLTGLKVLGIAGLLSAGFAAAQLVESPPQPEVYHGELVGSAENNLILRQRDETVIPVQVKPETRVLIDGYKKDFAGDAKKISEDLQGQEVRVVSSLDDPLVADRIKVSTRPLLAIIGLGLIFVLWTYSGWHEAAYVVSEVREERRTIPLALMIGTGSVMAIYLAINLAYLAGLGFEQAGESRTIAADLLGLVLGEGGGRAMALLVMLSCLGAVNGTIFTSSRIFAEMGKDHRLFSPLSRWSERWGTPVTALLVQGGLSMFMVVLVSVIFGGEDPFSDLVESTAAVFWFFFLLTVVSLFVLRVRDPQTPRPFRVPFFPLTPIVFCLACAWMMYSSITYKPSHSLLGLGLLALGIPMYLVSERLRKSGKDTDRGQD